MILKIGDYVLYFKNGEVTKKYKKDIWKIVGFKNGKVVIECLVRDGVRFSTEEDNLARINSLPCPLADYASDRSMKEFALHLVNKDIKKSKKIPYDNYDDYLAIQEGNFKDKTSAEIIEESENLKKKIELSRQEKMEEAYKVTNSSRQEGKTARDWLENPYKKANEGDYKLDADGDTMVYWNGKWVLAGPSYNEVPLNGNIKQKTGEVNMMNEVISSNVNAAKTGAVISAGNTLNKVVKNAVKSRIPRKYRKAVDSPLGDIVIANVASFAVQNFAKNNRKAQIASQAMMEAAMVEFMNSFNLEQIINDTLANVNLDDLMAE